MEIIVKSNDNFEPDFLLLFIKSIITLNLYLNKIAITKEEFNNLYENIINALELKLKETNIFLYKDLINLYQYIKKIILQYFPSNSEFLTIENYLTISFTIELLNKLNNLKSLLTKINNNKTDLLNLKIKLSNLIKNISNLKIYTPQVNGLNYEIDLYKIMEINIKLDILNEKEEQKNDHKDYNYLLKNIEDIFKNIVTLFDDYAISNYINTEVIYLYLAENISLLDNLIKKGELFPYFILIIHNILNLLNRLIYLTDLLTKFDNRNH